MQNRKRMAKIEQQVGVSSPGRWVIPLECLYGDTGVAPYWTCDKPISGISDNPYKEVEPPANAPRQIGAGFIFTGSKVEHIECKTDQE